MATTTIELLKPSQSIEDCSTSPSLFLKLEELCQRGESSTTTSATRFDDPKNGPCDQEPSEHKPRQACDQADGGTAEEVERCREKRTDQTIEVYTGPPLSNTRKRLLLAIFCAGLCMDILGFSVFFILVGPVSTNLGIQIEQQTWVITAFQVTFASFLLLWGRVCDLMGPRPVFIYGFAGFGTCNLVLSFLPEKYSFFVFRALSGVCGACIIPASYRLMTGVFNAAELRLGFTVMGISASIANAFGILLGGLVELIPGTGQMIAWRWYFRISAAIILVVATAAVLLIPPIPVVPKARKLRRLDLPGAALILTAILLIILGLTLGASSGFDKPAFLVPFLLGLALSATFLIYQAVAPQDFVLVPRSIWSHPNVTMWAVLSLLPYPWFAMNFVPFVEIYMRVHGETAIVAAARIIPQGLAATFMSVLLLRYPQLSLRPRVPFLLCMACMIGGYILFIYSGTQAGRDYWRYVLPGMLVGASGGHTAFHLVQFGLMTAVPPDQAGVAGALLQSLMQLGSATGISVQDGLFTVHPGSVDNFANVQISWWFGVGWVGVFAVIFTVFYRQPEIKHDEEVVGVH